MGQPIKKNILEIHPELKEETFITILVDGTNLLRLCFADTKVNEKGLHYGATFQFLLQLREVIKKVGSKLRYIYVVFDGAKSGLNRYEYWPLYKENRDKN